MEDAGAPAEVQSQFLKDFGTLYPSSPSAPARFQERGRELFGMALRVALAAPAPSWTCSACPLGRHPQESTPDPPHTDRTAEPPRGAGRGHVGGPTWGGGPGALPATRHGLFRLAGMRLETERYYLEISGKSNRHVRKKAVRVPSRARPSASPAAVATPGPPLDHARAGPRGRYQPGAGQHGHFALAEEGLVARAARAGTVRSRRPLDAWAEHYDLRRSPIAPSAPQQRGPDGGTAGPAGAAPGRAIPLTLWSGADQSLGEQASDYVALYWRGRPTNWKSAGPARGSGAHLRLLCFNL